MGSALQGGPGTANPGVCQAPNISNFALFLFTPLCAPSSFPILPCAPLAHCTLKPSRCSRCALQAPKPKVSGISLANEHCRGTWGVMLRNTGQNPALKALLSSHLTPASAAPCGTAARWLEDAAHRVIRAKAHTHTQRRSSTDFGISMIMNVLTRSL